MSSYVAMYVYVYIITIHSIHLLDVRTNGPGGIAPTQINFGPMHLFMYQL